MKKKEDYSDFRSLPKRKLSDVEKEYIFLEIERLRLSREKSILILNKGIFLFMIFLVFGMLAATNGLITTRSLNILVVAGLVVLVISILPYLSVSKKEENKIEEILDELMR